MSVICRSLNSPYSICIKRVTFDFSQKHRVVTKFRPLPHSMFFLNRSQIPRAFFFKVYVCCTNSCFFLESKGRILYYRLVKEWKKTHRVYLPERKPTFNLELELTWTVTSVDVSTIANFFYTVSLSLCLWCNMVFRRVKRRPWFYFDSHGY